MKPETTKTICIYHANCLDGFASAWAVRHFLGDDVEFIPANHGDAPPLERITDAGETAQVNVYLVDYCYPINYLIEVCHAADSVVVIDHHETSAQMVDDFGDHPSLANLDFNYSEGYSGCVLTWKVMRILTGAGNEAMPQLFLYIQDHDLWTHRLHDTKSIIASLYSHKFDFELWDYFIGLDDVGALCLEGEAINRSRKIIIDQMIERGMHEICIAGYSVQALQCPHQFASDAGNILAQDRDFSATYRYTKNGRMEVSLRSTDDGMDVRKIAEIYGGGGHRNAAGFSVKRDNFNGITTGGIIYS